jgi:hypothetical protein
MTERYPIHQSGSEQPRPEHLSDDSRERQDIAYGTSENVRKKLQLGLLGDSERLRWHRGGLQNAS